jgi:hypothetical protein
MKCELCGIESNDITFHHLIPRTLHQRYFKKLSREELNKGIDIDRECHFEIHKFHDNKHLAKELNTLEKLRADPKIRKYVDWKIKRNK